MRAYKAQWLESLAVAKLKYCLKQEAGKREHQLMNTCCLCMFCAEFCFVGWLSLASNQVNPKDYF